MSAPSLSRFTPSLMSPDLLERLFVARERLLDSILARIEAAPTTTGRNHTLLVGPRGAGKTHLISLAHHRAAALAADGLRIRLAWLPEDPWVIVSYRHLLAAIAERAGLEPARGATVAELEVLIAAAHASGGPIVVFVENLDQILEQLGTDDQQRLRHLLQNERSLLLVASTTRLDRNLSDQARPFYGFFTTTRLAPFDVEQATAMLRAIATESGQPELVEYLDSDEGQARIRTIAHLAGGQPRMWAALASSLSISGLNELVNLLLTRFDDLTPYYQEQLRRISARQRVVVAELASLDHPVAVKELAARLELDQRSLGKTMSELVELGWAATVTSPLTEGLVDRRLTHYELAEPMARLAFQIKETRGEPLALVVDFLKSWFDPSELLTARDEKATAYLTAAAISQDGDPVVAVVRQLHRLPDTRARSVEFLGTVDAALVELDEGRPAQFLALPSPIRLAVERLAIQSGLGGARRDLHRLALDGFGWVRHPQMSEWIARAGSLATRDAAGRHLLVRWLGRAWRFDEAFAAMEDEISEDGLNSRADVGYSAWCAGRFQDAVDIEESVVRDRERLLGRDHPETLSDRSNLAVTYGSLGRHHNALEIEETVLAEHERLLGAEHPDTLWARVILVSIYENLGRHDEAVGLSQAVVADCERLLGTEHYITSVARSALGSIYGALGRHHEALLVREGVLADRERLLGIDHRDTMLARANLAAEYFSVGRDSEALELEERVVADHERLLGPSHPSTLMSLANLSVIHAALDRFADAAALARRVLDARREILGPDHPDTLESERTLDWLRRRDSSR